MQVMIPAVKIPFIERYCNALQFKSFLGFVETDMKGKLARRRLKIPRSKPPSNGVCSGTYGKKGLDREHFCSMDLIDELANSDIKSKTPGDDPHYTTKLED